MMTRVVTDGAADLPETLITSLDITVVRGRVRFGDSTWRGDAVRFWEDLEKGPDLPSTEPPSTAQLSDAYAGPEPALAIHVSAELSRTVAHARDATASSGGTVQVVDSRSLSVGTGLVALAAAEAVQAGADAVRLGAMVNGWVDQLHLHAVIDDAGFLVRGGRAGLVAAGAGTHAHRQVMAVKGHVIPICQVRHRSEALRALVGHIRDHVGDGVSRWAVGHGAAPDVEECVDRLTAVFGCDPSYVTLLGAPTGSHLGPRSVVVGFFSDG